jgi:hypothetical protein
MTEVVAASQIETVVGVRRHETKHYGRAVSVEEKVYILHSQECLEVREDLRRCPFSLALDRGIDVERWVEDVPLPLAIIDGELVPEPVQPPEPGPHACGITQTVNGREWICIAEPHDTAYQKSRRPDSRGYAAKSERHYFVPRYPMRGKS